MPTLPVIQYPELEPPLSEPNHLPRRLTSPSSRTMVTTASNLCNPQMRTLTLLTVLLYDDTIAKAFPM
jgi:hypothetical protein